MSFINAVTTSSASFLSGRYHYHFIPSERDSKRESKIKLKEMLSAALRPEKGIKREADTRRGIVLFCLGCSKTKIGRYQEATKLLNLALVEFEKQYGFHSGERLEIAECLNSLGLIYQKDGHFEKALECHAKALSIYEKSYSDNILHPSILRTKSYLGMAETRHESNLDTAEQRLETILIVQKAFYDALQQPFHLDIAESLNHLGYCYLTQKKTKLAFLYFNKAFQAYQSFYATVNIVDHHSIAKTLSYIGKALIEQGELEQGKAHCDNALGMFERLYESTNHPDMVDCLNDLGKVGHKLKDVEKARAYYTKALYIGKFFLRDNHPLLEDILENLMHLQHKGLFERIFG